MNQTKTCENNGGKKQQHKVQRDDTKEQKRLSFCLLDRNSFYHSHLVSSPVTSPLTFVFVTEVCFRLYYYVSYIKYLSVLTFFFPLQVFIFYICYHKKTRPLNQCIKNVHHDLVVMSDQNCYYGFIALYTEKCLTPPSDPRAHVFEPQQRRVLLHGNDGLLAKTQLCSSPLVNCAKKLKHQ